MEFCNKCGAVLIKKTKNFGCPRCGASSKEKPNLKTSEKIEEKQKIEVIKKNFQTEPIVNNKCEKCGNKQAYFWTVQNRASDESETKFFKCTKCGHTTRNYD